MPTASSMSTGWVLTSPEPSLFGVGLKNMLLVWNPWATKYRGRLNGC